MINFTILSRDQLQDYVDRCKRLDLFGRLYDAAVAELGRRLLPGGHF